MSYLDLKETGPPVMYAPPGVIGMYTDFYRRLLGYVLWTDKTEWRRPEELDKDPKQEGVSRRHSALRVGHRVLRSDLEPPMLS